MTTESLIEKLKAGNARYVSGSHEVLGRNASKRRDATSSAQSPFAIILGCADSRVPPEVVFDQSIGDLFVVRVAGNVVAPTALGSIEYAIRNLGSALIVVLGHSSCGAVKGTMDIVADSSAISPNLQSLVDRIRPAVQPWIEERKDPAAVAKAVAANARASMDALIEQSGVIRRMVDAGEVTLAAAVYDLSSGNVDFLE